MYFSARPKIAPNVVPTHFKKMAETEVAAPAPAPAQVEAESVIDVMDFMKIKLSSKNLTRESTRHLGLVGIRENEASPVVAWIVSAEGMDRIEDERRNLVKAKVRAIIGTAVFGAGLAVAVGALIGMNHKYVGYKGI